MKPTIYMLKRAELTKLQREAGAIKRRINLLEVELNGQRERKYLPDNRSQLPVSDHAVLRYIERVHGLSLEPLRQRILTNDVKNAIDAGEDYAYLEGYVLPIMDKRVATILTKEMVE